MEYLLKYLRRSCASSQISDTRIWVTRSNQKLCWHPNTGVVAVNVLIHWLSNELAVSKLAVESYEIYGYTGSPKFPHQTLSLYSISQDKKKMSYRHMPLETPLERVIVRRNDIRNEQWQTRVITVCYYDAKSNSQKVSR